MKDYMEQKQHNLMPDKVAEITLDLHTQSKSGWIWGSLKQMIGIFAVAAECLFHFTRLLQTPVFSYLEHHQCKTWQVV